MPTLPTLTISDQAIWNRVFSAFGGDPERYKEWLKGAIQNYVRIQEEIELRQQTDEVNNLLDGVN